MVLCANRPNMRAVLLFSFVTGQFPHFTSTSLLNDTQYVDIPSPAYEITPVRLPPYLSTEELIRRRGYPLEIHNIRTDDNFILMVHRIPYGKSSGPSEGHKHPIYLLHGSVQSSADWLVNLQEDNCLPFILANQGYDVWIGSIRGTIYSSRHVSLSNEQTIFWNFSIDELAKYDLPNTIDYILMQSNRSRLHYIGFSLGNTIFYMTMASKPEYNDKIGLHISYSPVVYFQTFPKITSFLALFLKPLEFLQKITGGFPAPPQGITFMVNQFLSAVCSQNIFVGICREVLFLFGFGPKNTLGEETASVLGHLLAPSSVKILLHVLQMAKSDRFCRYDEGPKENLRLYGHSAPPDYEVGKVSAPVVLYLGEEDLYANKRGMDRLARNLPNVIEYYKVPLPQFTHLDFIYGTHANYLVYNHTINLLNKFS